jgi:hypothetical protein
MNDRLEAWANSQDASIGARQRTALRWLTPSLAVVAALLGLLLGLPPVAWLALALTLLAIMVPAIVLTFVAVGRRLGRAQDAFGWAARDEQSRWQAFDGSGIPVSEEALLVRVTSGSGKVPKVLVQSWVARRGGHAHASAADLVGDDLLEPSSSWAQLLARLDPASEDARRLGAHANVDQAAIHVGVDDDEVWRRLLDARRMLGDMVFENYSDTDRLFVRRRRSWGFALLAALTAALLALAAIVAVLGRLIA